jgi:hypothetical protein
MSVYVERREHTFSARLFRAVASRGEVLAVVGVVVPDTGRSGRRSSELSLGSRERVGRRRRKRLRVLVSGLEQSSNGGLGSQRNVLRKIARVESVDAENRDVFVDRLALGSDECSSDDGKSKRADGSHGEDSVGGNDGEEVRRAKE